MPRLVSAENWIGRLPPRVQGEVAAAMSWTRYGPGEEISAAGATAGAVHQMISGYAKVSGLFADGRRSYVALYAPGACFDETAVVSERPYRHSKTALTDAVVAALPAAEFWRLYHAHPEIPEILCRKFAAAIGRQIESRDLRATHRLRKLVAMLFEELAAHCAEARAANSCVIAAPISQTEIGERFDVTRQSIQREITALKAAGLIDKQGGRWVVRDLARLAAV